MKPFFSVVVCSYNRETYIADAIDSLARQTLSPELFEVFIVDNNSKDKTAQVAKERLEYWSPTHQMYYVFESQQGLCFARNRGINEARGQFVVYIDDDGIAEPNFLQVQYDFLTQNPQVQGLGGKIIPKYVHGKPAWIDGILEGLVSKVDHGEQVFQYPMKKYPVGCNMTYSKELLTRVGGFDTAVGQVGDNLVRGDETELYQRVRQVSGQIYYLPNSVVHHVIERDRLTPEHIQKMSKGVGRGRKILFNRANFLGKSKLILEQVVKAIGALVFAFYYLIQGKTEKAAAWIRFRRDVWSGFVE